MNTKPKGYFEFDSNGQTIKGRFCLWSIELFKDRAGLKTVDEFFQLMDGLSVKALAQLLLCAVEYMHVKENREFNFTELDAYDWIEELGQSDLVKTIEKSMAVDVDESQKKSNNKKQAGRNLRS